MIELLNKKSRLIKVVILRNPIKIEQFKIKQCFKIQKSQIIDKSIIKRFGFKQENNFLRNKSLI